MNTTTPFQNLSSQIEQVIQAHIAASYRAAAEAVEQAFARAGRARAAAPHALRAETSTKRRGKAEMAALGERFYQVVCAKPGETMTVLAAELGVTSRELTRPVLFLKRAGKIRSVGQRHFTRYFPLAN
jgi:predicted Zn-dependent protease